MTFSKEDPRNQLNVRVDDEIWQALDNVADNKNEWVNTAIRKHLIRAGELESSGSGRIGPIEDDLAIAYDTLLDATRGGGLIELESAESSIAQRLQTPKNTVRYRIIDELQRRGYIRVKTGMESVRIKVYE